MPGKFVPTCQEGLRFSARVCWMWRGNKYLLGNRNSNRTCTCIYIRLSVHIILLHHFIICVNFHFTLVAISEQHNEDLYYLCYSSLIMPENIQDKIRRSSRISTKLCRKKISQMEARVPLYTSGYLTVCNSKCGSVQCTFSIAKRQCPKICLVFNK